MRRKRMKYEITVVGHRFMRAGHRFGFRSQEEWDIEFEVFTAFCSMDELIHYVDLADECEIYAISARRRPEYELAEEDNVIAVNFAERAREELNFEDQS